MKSDDLITSLVLDRTPEGRRDEESRQGFSGDYLRYCQAELEKLLATAPDERDRMRLLDSLYQWICAITTHLEKKCRHKSDPFWYRHFWVFEKPFRIVPLFIGLLIADGIADRRLIFFLTMRDLMLSDRKSLGPLLSHLHEWIVAHPPVDGGDNLVDGATVASLAKFMNERFADLPAGRKD